MSADPRLLGGARLWPLVCLRSAGLPFAALAPLPADEVVRAVDAGADRQTVDRLLSDYWARLPAALSSSPWADRMLAALTWQNPSAAETTARPVLADRYRPGTAKQRYKVASVVTYLQRYAARNDTIGFFGPLAWGRVTSSAGRLGQQVDRSLVVDTRVFLEDWAVHQIAVALARHDPAAYQPVLAPHCRVDRHMLILPMDGRVELTEAEALVLSRCSGTSTAAEIVASTGLSPAAVENVLATFERRGLVGQVAQVDPPAFDQLPCAPLARLRGVPRIERLLASIDDAARALVPVAHDPARLRPALDRLHDLFSDTTGRPANRAASELRTARTVARVECLRGVRFSLGQTMLHELDAPMRVLVHVARWLVHEAVVRTEQILWESWRDHVRGGGGVMPLCDLWLRHADMWYTTRPDHLAPLIADAHARWRACLGELRTAVRRVYLDPMSLLGAVQRAFPPHPDPLPRVEAYACPDIMVDTSVEPAHGAPRYVLGEMHLGRNTLSTAVLSECSDVGKVLDGLWCADGGQPASVSVSYLAAGRRMRSRFAGYADVELAVSAQSPALSRDAWRLSDVDVLADGPILTARHRDNGQVLPLLTLLSDPIAVSMSNLFRPVAPADHQPRVTVGPLVVARETWVLKPADVDRLRSASGSDRLAGMRLLAHQRAMPRYLFATTAPAEKPILVDTAAPASVDAFVRHLRRHTGTCALTEMLPAPSGLWLRDHEDYTYTSELRLALALFAG